MKRVWLGLGGNIGSVKEAMCNSISCLTSGGLEIVSVSSLYSTPPWGLVDQPDFLNCCLEARTQLDPHSVLSLCQSVEKVGGRTREIRWGPRTIDIDILFYEGYESSTSTLELPHPRICDRAFVLVPLCEISPNLQLSGNKVSDLSMNIDSAGIEISDSNPDWWRSSTDSTD